VRSGVLPFDAPQNISVVEKGRKIRINIMIEMVDKVLIKIPLLYIQVDIPILINSKIENSCIIQKKFR